MTAALSVVALAGVASASNPVTLDQYAWDFAAEHMTAQDATGITPRGTSPCGATPAHCQGVVDANTPAPGYSGRSSDLVPLAAAPTADFGTADNFTLTAASSISSVCFWGFYGAGGPTAGNESFRIRIFNTNNSGPIGFPGTQLHEFTVGANPRFSTITPSTTLTRNAAVGAVLVNVFSWTATFPTINLTPGCYWIEIVGNTNGIVEGARFRWGISNATPNVSQDNAIYQKDNAVAYAAAQLVANQGDRAFCLDINLNANSCGIPPSPVNNTCATATTITAPFTATNLNTLLSITTATPFCGGNPVNGNAVWFRVVGNGSTFTAGTCGPNTNFDTVVNVYCRTAGTCGTNNVNLNCVANNDTGPATCTGGAGGDPSQVTWASAAGVEYLIAVYGFEITAGFFDFSLTSAAGTPGPACASDRCAVNISGITPVEVDACGASTNSGCTGAGVGLFTLNDDFAGRIYNLGTNRDFDFWELASVIPDTVGDGTAWLDVVYSVEFPGIFNFFTGACSAASNGTFLGGAFANYLDGGPACPRAELPRTIQLNTAAGAPFRLNLLPVDFGGVTCASGENEYTITVRLSTLGACCIPASACFLTIELDCDDQGGNFLASATTCGPSDPCTAPVQGACCRGTTCALDTSANCPAVANQAYKGDNTVCNVLGNNTTPCCKADFNQGGTVTVQDIFDFLAAYFSANPLADINGGGTTVQDIFDFLAAYFGGCP